jgi:hypothetical protein
MYYILSVRDSAGTTTGFQYISRDAAVGMYQCNGLSEKDLAGLERLEPASTILPDGARLMVSRRPLYEPF